MHHLVGWAVWRTAVCRGCRDGWRGRIRARRLRKIETSSRHPGRGQAGSISRHDRCSAPPRHAGSSRRDLRSATKTTHTERTRGCNSGHDTLRARNGVADLRPGARQRPNNAVPSCTSPIHPWAARHLQSYLSPVGWTAGLAAAKKLNQISPRVRSEYDQLYHRKAQAKLRLNSRLFAIKALARGRASPSIMYALRP